MNSLDFVAKVLKGASQEIRLRVLELLAQEGPISFSEMMFKLNLSSGKLNFHLRKLREAGLVGVNSSGLYVLTRIGRWMVARVHELRRLEDGETSELVILDYRGIPKRLRLYELVSELARKHPVGTGELEELIMRAYSRLRELGSPVRESLLLSIVEAELLKEGSAPAIISEYTCIPPKLRELVFKSYLDSAYAYVKESLCADIVGLEAVSRISDLLYDYYMRGLLLIRDPAYVLKGAQTVVVNIDDNPSTLMKIAGELANRIGEIVVVLDRVPEEALMLDRLLPRNRLSLLLPELDRSSIRVSEFRSVSIILHSAEERSERAASWLLEVNAPVNLIISRGSYAPSPSLAMLPIPEPGTAYVLPVHASIPLTALYSEMALRGIDVTHVLELVARELVKVSEKFQASGVRSRLRRLVKSVESLQPQLALTGFECSMMLHHKVLPFPRLAEFSERFWRHLSSLMQGEGVTLTASLADERLYPLASSTGFNPISAFSQSVKRSLYEIAALEGSVQKILNGGSLWPLRVKSYVTADRLRRVLELAENYGVKWISFHLEFTSCNRCGDVSVGLKGICPSCLSSSVTQLIRPLTAYVPVDSQSNIVLDEYFSRTSYEELEEALE